MDGPRGTEHGMKKDKRDKDLPSKTDGSKASTKDNGKKTKIKTTDLNKGEQRTDTRLNDNGLDKRITSKPNDSNSAAASHFGALSITPSKLSSRCART